MELFEGRNLLQRQLVHLLIDSGDFTGNRRLSPFPSWLPLWSFIGMSIEGTNSIWRCLLARLFTGLLAWFRLRRSPSLNRCHHRHSPAPCLLLSRQLALGHPLLWYPLGVTISSRHVDYAGLFNLILKNQK